MKNLAFTYASSCGVSVEHLASISALVRPEIERLSDAQRIGYDSPYASINVSKDRPLLNHVRALVHQKRELRPAALVVVGIGGSNLGTMAILEALYGKLYNEQQPDIKVYFADTVDTDHLYDIVLLLEQEFEMGHDVIITMISKSGTTMETVANAEVLIHVLKKYKPEDYQKYVVAITDEGSKLWDLAGAHQFDRLAIPANVGGRYSVFSAVGLFPLALVGVDIEQLHEGAREMLFACSNPHLYENPAALSAAILYAQYHKGFTIHDTFLFSVDLESLGKWYRQLMGESIGKAQKISGPSSNLGTGKAVGITPTVSIGSTDLHSVAQLYLGGPHDKFTTFVSVEESKSDVVVPRKTIFHQLVASLPGKPLSSIMHAILKGVQSAYVAQERPFIEVALPEKNEFYVAQYMQYAMCQMIYLGYLLDVDPFDQPHVELYKEQTRKMM